MVLTLASQPELPTAQEAVEEAIATMLDSREDMERLGVTYRKVVDIFDTSVDPPRRTEQKVWLMWYENGESRQKLIEIDGEPVTDEPIESPGKDAFTELPKRFEYSWHESPVVELEETSYYVIELKPLKGAGKGFKLPQEKTLARMRGTLYINIEGMYIKSLYAELPESFRPIWPVTKVNRASFLFSQRETTIFHNDGVDVLIVFSEIMGDYSYAFFGQQTDEQRRVTYYGYEDFEPKPPQQ
jgi:hypothetical protein